MDKLGNSFISYMAHPIHNKMFLAIAVHKYKLFHSKYKNGFWLTVGRECTAFSLYFSSFRFFTEWMAGPNNSSDS